jgi:hypothetical protein
MLKNLKYLPLIAMGLMAAPGANAGMIPTADSPAFDRDLSIDAGIAVELGTKTTTTTQVHEVEPPAPEDCPPEDWEGDDEGFITDGPDSFTTTSTVSEATTRVLNSQRANIRVAPGTLATISHNNGEVSIGGAVKVNNLVAASAGVSLNGDINGSVAVSPVKNLALYAEYVNQGANYGVQYQAGDVAIQAYTRPDAQAYGVGVAINFGQEAPKPRLEPKVQAPEVKTPEVKTPVLVAPSRTAPKVDEPVYIRGRG